MSAPDRRLVFTPRAQSDMASLLLFSERQWGKDQRLRYRARIDRALRDLIRFPDLGRPREDIAPELRGHRVGEHVVYYRIEVQVLRVVRVLHFRRDLTEQFEEP